MLQQLWQRPITARHDVTQITDMSTVCNRFQFKNSVRPMQLDHDYYSRLPSEGERDAQSITRCSTAHHGLFQAFPRANRS